MRPRRTVTFNASLSINTAELALLEQISRRLSHLSACVSVSDGLYVREVYCSSTADLIQVPFGVVSGVGRGTRVLDGGGNRHREAAVFGVNLGRPITNGDVAAYLCESDTFCKSDTYVLPFGRTCLYFMHFTNTLYECMYVCPLRSASSRWGSRHKVTRGSIWAHASLYSTDTNSISIGSAVFAQYTGVPNTQIYVRHASELAASMHRVQAVQSNKTTS